MITPKTTFIVGAGGSDPYGLPIASKLCATGRNLQPPSDIYQLLKEVLDGDSRLLNAVLKDLCGHPAASIDAFLEQRQHQPDTMRIGKLLIAALMGQAISGQNWVLHYHGDWIQHIIVHMSRGTRRAADFANTAQNVHFITFNFDSVIEERSAQLLQRIYNGDEGLPTAIDSIRVTHVHGHLAPPPNEPIFVNDRSSSAVEVNPKWAEWTKNSEEHVHVVLDDIDQVLLGNIRQIVHASHIICFLGFSYDRGNLVKLGFPEQRSNVAIFGSAFDLSEEQRSQATARITQYPGMLSLAGRTEKCLDVLQNRHILRD